MCESDCDVVLVDDHPLLGEGLRTHLRKRDVTLEIASVIDVEAILRLVAAKRPKLVVLDYSMPAIGVSLPLIDPIRELGPHVLMLTGTNDAALWGALIEAGALGVMGKEEPLDDLLDGIEAALSGAPFRPGRSAEYRDAWHAQRRDELQRLEPFLKLSVREAEVAAAMIRGESPAQIATSSFVSVGTVRSQIKSVYRKLGVSSQLELVTFARTASWNGPSDDQVTS